MGMFSAWLDDVAKQRFRTDDTGRLVFLPFGPRKSGYYVDSPSDKSPIEALVKMYTVAAALINLLGSMSSYAITFSLISADHWVALGPQFRKFLTVYAVGALLFYILPAWILWALYKRLALGLCSQLTVVDPGLVQQMRQPESQTRKRALVVLAAISLIILAIGAFLLTGFRRHSPGKNPHQTQSSQTGANSCE